MLHKGFWIFSEAVWKVTISALKVSYSLWVLKLRPNNTTINYSISDSIIYFWEAIFNVLYLITFLSNGWGSFGEVFANFTTFVMQYFNQIHVHSVLCSLQFYFFFGLKGKSFTKMSKKLMKFLYIIKFIDCRIIYLVKQNRLVFLGGL